MVGPDRQRHPSPAAQTLTTRKMLIDPRKRAGIRLIDLLTGMKVGTYDLPRQKLYAMQEANRRLIEEDPLSRTLRKAYIPADKRAMASEKTLEAPVTQSRIERLVRELLKRERLEAR